MIGVVAEQRELAAVREFFELFKSPWELYQPGKHYDVLLSSTHQVPENNTKLVVIYASQQNSCDARQAVNRDSEQGPQLVQLCGQRIPIYGSCLLSERNPDELLFHEEHELLASSRHGAQRTVVHIGYDLFQEIRYMLTVGQPVKFADTPTLELHIAIFRNLIISKGVSFVEILPAPAGHRFIVCLTHDIDHPRVRYHVLDHTMFGFLYRALVGSTIQVCRGKRSLRQLAVNWKAAISLPLVYAGVVNDFWDQVSDYLNLEKDLASTFFVIPIRGNPGVASHGEIKGKRAASYDVTDIADDLNKLQAANREVGVHGIDAWCDAERGRVELERVEKITGPRQLGTRMHWLYFDAQTPVALEKAGFDYDSTVGYNETIGYRAGTTQVFKPLNVDRLLELPLHIMDTALFFPEYMNSSDEQANVVMRPLIENAKKLGGVLTTNWHDRSLGPERLWSQPYRQLLDELKSNKPWFATACDAVSWFRKRRSATITEDTNDGDVFRARISVGEGDGSIPGLVARVYTPTRREDPFVDLGIDSETTIEVPI